MGLTWENKDGQTPLTEEEREGLLIPTIATRGELDEFEQQNIEQALQWLFGRRLKAENVYAELFIQMIHRRMFGEVWEWAGSFRRTNKNLGADKWAIAPSLRYLLENAMYWFEHNTFSPDEAAIRFKHQIVSIHCFPNGNGRHSRLMADIIIEKIYKLPVFSWGAAAGYPTHDIRNAYLSAIRQADQRNYAPLIAFARA